MCAASFLYELKALLLNGSDVRNSFVRCKRLSKYCQAADSLGCDRLSATLEPAKDVINSHTSTPSTIDILAADENIRSGKQADRALVFRDPESTPKNKLTEWHSLQLVILANLNKLRRQYRESSIIRCWNMASVLCSLLWAT